MDISECKFSNNKATGNGGALFAWESTVSVDNSEFVSNVADMEGGAIHVQGLNTTSIMTITGSEFSSNRAVVVQFML